MVVNLCLPHFNTTVHCNKLCADGYDVTNLVSADPTHRKRGFKLEYFLRPPVQVTLKFDFQVELCRVDVELWPWGMDRGQVCKRLELSTSSDQMPFHNFNHINKLTQQKEHIQMQLTDQNEQKRGNQERCSKSHQCNGYQQGGKTQTEPQRKGHVFKCQSSTIDSYPEPEFKLVGRCELKEETRVCFTRSNFISRRPFLSPPPPQPPNCYKEDLWSKGLLSLSAVTQLRVTMPFGGAASALGLKTLVVWGQPARCCTADEVERIKRIHETSEKQLSRPVLFTSAVDGTKPLLQSGTHPSFSNLSIPEEFLDPITQEVMTLPMLLPSGMSVDNTTLEEHQKREATWSRPPNDPFTGVPFTSTSHPLPNPLLKSRIDHFLLQKGMVRKDGILGRQREAEDPQTSRLVASNVAGQTQNNSCLSKNSNQTVVDTRNTNWTTQSEDSARGHSSEHGNRASNSLLFSTDNKSKLERKNKRDQERESTEGLTVEKQTKRPRNDAVSLPSCSSHEQRLSASLDEALSSALQGRPSFTSNLYQQKRLSLDSDPQKTEAGAPNMPTGEKKCVSCSCSVSVYSKSATSIYRLTCSHLLCHSCLKRESQPLKFVTKSTSSLILCPSCQSSTQRSDIVRVHH